MNSLSPLRPHLSFGQRLMASRAQPDVVLEALDRGWLDPAELNAMHDGKALVQIWLATNFGDSVLDLAALHDVRPTLDWPVGADPTALPLGKENQSIGGVWAEHLLVRLVERGLDPLQPWVFPKKGYQTHDNLLEWASSKGHPWLLRACLQAVGSAKARALAQQNKPGEYDDTDDDTSKTVSALPRLQAALSKTDPLIAQVWFDVGAPVCTTSDDETPIFYANSVPALEWALAHEGPAALTRRNRHGQLPVEKWRRTAEDTSTWAKMQTVAQRVGPESLGQSWAQGMALQSALSQADQSGAEACMKAGWAPGARLPNGTTPLGHIARFAMDWYAKSSRTRDVGTVKDAMKIVAFLWPRTDLEEAGRPNPDGLSDRDLAVLVSDTTDQKTAKKAMRLLQQRIPFQPPAPESVLIWCRNQPHVSPSEPLPGAQRLVRRWLADAIAGIASDDPMRALHLLEEFLDGTSMGENAYHPWWSQHVPSLLNELNSAATAIGASGILRDRMLTVNLRLLALGLTWESPPTHSLDPAQCWRERTQHPSDKVALAVVGGVHELVSRGARPPDPTVLAKAYKVFKAPKFQDHPCLNAVQPAFQKLRMEQALALDDGASAGPRVRL